MRIKTLVFTAALSAGICLLGHGAAAAGKKEASHNSSGGGMDKEFVMKAANGGMTEVELGKLAAEKGGSQEVKDFGSRMVTDHGKVNDQLKEIAGKMNVEVPAKVDAMHQAKIDKMSAMSGAAFDKAYVHGMIEAHEKDIASFEKADKQVKNADLKKLIEDTIPTMKEHLEMVKKFDQAKKG